MLRTTHERDLNRLKDLGAEGIGHLHHLAVMIPAVQNRADAEQHGLLHAQEWNYDLAHEARVTVGLRQAHTRECLERALYGAQGGKPHRLLKNDHIAGYALERLRCIGARGTG